MYYGPDLRGRESAGACLPIFHAPEAWDLFEGLGEVRETTEVDGLAVALPRSQYTDRQPKNVNFDLVANAFYFLSSWDERQGHRDEKTRFLFSDSVYSRLNVPQDIVDRYLDLIQSRLELISPEWASQNLLGPAWPSGKEYALVLSHDVDFLPSGIIDQLKQGAKTVGRHLIRERRPADAVRSGFGLLKALTQGRDPYGCVPEIIRHEKKLGVRSSFQVAVARRHPSDVNYDFHSESIQDYLSSIPDAGFDLCLHGSYRSTEAPGWYVEEARLLGDKMRPPKGSRQHFLSFNYDDLFTAQEKAGIEYDMSMGYPDRAGPRAGFSYPYFPYCLADDRPYNVVEISLCLMDVTLRSYMSLSTDETWEHISGELSSLRGKGGSVSCVWHPIVFGGARDPGMAGLYWRMVEEVKDTNGLATDGRTVNAHWREGAAGYESFSFVRAS